MTDMADTTESVPKVIHYCWFGRSPLPEQALRCIESWKCFLPDWEVVRWDESNFDVSCCRYASAAYNAGKWAFVADYARFKILHEHGGVYFDVDVELLAPIDDLLEQGPFVICSVDGTECEWADLEEGQTSIKVDPSLGLAATPGLALYWEILRLFDILGLWDPNALFSSEVAAKRTTQILRALGLKNETGAQQVAGVWVHPSSLASEGSGRSPNEIGDARLIHHHTMSWLEPSYRAQFEIEAKLLNAGLSKAAASGLSKVVAILRHGDLRRVCGIAEKVFLRKCRNRAVTLIDWCLDMKACGRPLTKIIPSRFKAQGANRHEPTPYFILDELFQSFEMSENTRLLDVGCGLGRVLAHFVASRCPGTITGVELDPDLAERCQKWSRRYSNVEVVPGSVLDMDLSVFTDIYLFNPFDGATFRRFIEKAEAEVSHPLTLCYLSDHASTEIASLLSERPGWELKKREWTWKTCLRGLQRYSVWRYVPPRGLA